MCLTMGHYNFEFIWRNGVDDLNLKLMIKKWRDFLAFFWYLDIIYIASCKPLAQEDLCVQIVYNAMSRNRFQENKKYFHRADNQNLVPCQLDILLLFLMNKIKLHHYFHYKYIVFSISMLFLPYFLCLWINWNNILTNLVLLPNHCSAMLTLHCSINGICHIYHTIYKRALIFWI